MANTLEQVRAALTTALGTVGELNVYAYPPKVAVPPFAFVMCESVNYDLTMARGTDRFVFNVYVATGAQGAEDQFNDFDLWVDGDTFKAVLEAADTFSVRVTTAEFTNISLASADYAAVKFTLDIAA